MSIFGFLAEVKNREEQDAKENDSESSSSSSDDDSVKPVTAAAIEPKPAEAKAPTKTKKSRGKSQGSVDSRGSGAKSLKGDKGSGGALGASAAGSVGGTASEGTETPGVRVPAPVFGGAADNKVTVEGGKKAKGGKKSKKNKKADAGGDALGDSRDSGAEPLKTSEVSASRRGLEGDASSENAKGKKRRRKAAEPKAAPQTKEAAKEVVVAAAPAKMDVDNSDDSDSDSDSSDDDDVVVAVATSTKGKPPQAAKAAAVVESDSSDSDSDDSSDDSDDEEDVVVGKAKTSSAPAVATAVAAVAATSKEDDSESESSDDEIINAPIGKVDRAQESPKFKKQLGNVGFRPKEGDVGATVSPRGSRQEIYCGGLPFSMTEVEIRELFESDCGPVTRINLLQRKGIAFITFSSEEAAAKAVEYNETSYMGRTLKINLTSDRPPRPAAKPASFQQSGNDDYDENKPSKTVVVRNLSYYATEEAMKELFSECGQIVRCHIPKFEDTGKSTGKCFITYTTEQEAARAVEYNNTDIDGRTVTIRYVQPKPPGGGGSNFRGGRGGGRGTFRGGRGGGGNRGSSRGGAGTFGRKLFAPSGANANALGTAGSGGGGNNAGENAPKSIVFEDSD